MSGEFSCKNSIDVKINSRGFSCCKPSSILWVIWSFFSLPELMPRIHHPLPLNNRMFLCRIQIHSSSLLAITFLNQSCADYCAELGMTATGNIWQLWHLDRWVSLKSIVITRKNLSWGHSSAGRAPAWHAGGQRFESAWLHLIFFAITIYD